VGAGVAGLSAAEALSRAGIGVVLLERHEQPGGRWRAATDPRTGDPIEIGPHVIPAWYHNLRDLLALVDAPLAELPGLALLRQGGPRTVRRFYPPADPAGLLRFFLDGPLSPAETFAYGWLVLDSIGRTCRGSRSGGRDRSRHEALRRWWLSSEAVSEFEGDMVRESLALSSRYASATTLGRASAFFLRRPRPYMHVVAGPVDSCFLEPLVSLLRRRGVDFRPGRRVRGLEVRERRVEGVTVGGGAGTVRCDAVVLATPVEVTRRLLRTAAVLQNAPFLRRLDEIGTAPMGTLDLHVDDDLAGLPPGPITCMGARPGLAVVNLGKTWRQHTPATGTRVSMAVTAADRLPAPSSAVQRERARDEALSFLGVRADQVVSARWRSNADCPLPLNTVGSWRLRPEVRCDGLDNLCFAGDWVRNPVEITSLEGAACAGRDAARATASRLGVAGVPGAREPAIWSPLLVRAAALALRPLAGLCGLVAGRGRRRPGKLEDETDEAALRD